MAIQDYDPTLHEPWKTVFWLIRTADWGPAASGLALANEIRALLRALHERAAEADEAKAVAASNYRWGYRSGMEPKCARCGHPQSWHRHDDSGPDDMICRCIGHDCMASGHRGTCDCPDFVEATNTAQPAPEPPQGNVGEAWERLLVTITHEIRVLRSSADAECLATAMRLDDARATVGAALTRGEQAEDGRDWPET